MNDRLSMSILANPIAIFIKNGNTDLQWIAIINNFRASGSTI
jgi:hypothetical protein